MLKFSDNLYEQLQNEIAEIVKTESKSIRILSGVLKCTRISLQTLREQVLKHPFKDKDEEIYFFKHIKPRFYCLHVFYLEKYNIEASVPASDMEALKNF